LSRTPRRIAVALIAATLGAIAALPAGSPARDRAVSVSRPQFALAGWQTPVMQTQWQDQALHADRLKVWRLERLAARERARRRREHEARLLAAERAEQAAERAQQASVTAASADSQETAAASVSSGSPQAIAQAILAAAGWGGQWSCFDSIISRESGWSVTAENPNSGAYGLPQALPGSKMGPGWQDSAYVQLHWVIDEYIPGAYGTPCGAWAFWQAHGWY
jgi:hypothetical protein